MAPSRSDELAARFADRLQKAPPRGQVIVETTRSRPERLVRGASGTRLRGHLVPHALHGDARRLKLSQQARRGRRVTWDDVATEGLELLLAQRADAGRRLTEIRRLTDQATAGPRLVQATIPAELDDAFSELRLDLTDEIGYDVSYEQLWAAALLIWLRAHR